MFLKPWAHILREPFEFLVKTYQRLHGCNYVHDLTDVTTGQTNYTFQSVVIDTAHAHARGSCVKHCS